VLDLSHLVVPEVIFGHGALRLVGRSAANVGARRVLLVTDPDVRAAGWTEAVRASLDEAGIGHVLFDQVTPNPRVGEVAAGARLYLDAGCNAIVVVGGGSPVDCAKGIGIVATNGGSIRDYDGIDRVPRPIPPLVCVPTTAGAAADVSQFAIVTEPERRTKFAVVSKAIVPDVSLVDPQPLTTQPAALTATAGLDALSHAIESLASTAATPLGDLLALEAVRLLARNVPRALEAPQDLEIRAATMYGCFYAGVAFSASSLGLVHAMAHALGGIFDLPHGEAIGAVLPQVVAYNFEAVPSRYRRLGEALGLDLDPRDDRGAAAALADHLRGFVARLGLSGALPRAGVGPGSFAELAESAALDACMATNPRCPTPDDLERLYALAL
jgi:alcohol dehydrogenase class IV